jgi:hypothetical protein
MEPLVQLSTDLNRLLVPDLSGSVAWCRSCISQVRALLLNTGAVAAVSHAVDCPLPHDSFGWPDYYQSPGSEGRVPNPTGDITTPVTVATPVLEPGVPASRAAVLEAKTDTTR